MRPKDALPWHWLLAVVALLAALPGAWMLWGPMRIAQPLPPAARDLFQLKEAATAADLQALQHRQVMLVGRFTRHKVVLAGRDMAGRSGYYVLSPLVERGGSGLAVLVLRGWVPAGTRGVVDDVLTPRHDITIEGRLALGSSLGDRAQSAAEQGLVRRNLGLQAYADEIGVPLVPMVLLQEPGADWSERDIRQDLFQRRWPELYPQDRNLARRGWALLALAAALGMLGLWLRLRLRPWRGQDEGSEFPATAPVSEGHTGHPRPRQRRTRSP